MQALWLYIKHNQLQDGHEREYINCNRYFRQVSVDLPTLLAAPPCPAPCSTAPVGQVSGHLLHTDPGMVHFPLCPQRHHRPFGTL